MSEEVLVKQQMPRSPERWCGNQVSCHTGGLGDAGNASDGCQHELASTEKQISGPRYSQLHDFHSG